MRMCVFVLCGLFLVTFLSPLISLGRELQNPAPIPLADLRAMAGPWECRDAKGNNFGVWITSRTEVQRSAGTETITSQT